MKSINVAIVAVFFISSCGGNDEAQSQCSEIALSVIIPAVNAQLFDINQVPLNVCDAILTISSANGSEIIYGSAINGCANTFSLRGGYDLIEHDILVEKAGYLNQRFESVVPVATQCGYETVDLAVTLVTN